VSTRYTQDSAQDINADRTDVKSWMIRHDVSLHGLVEESPRDVACHPPRLLLAVAMCDHRPGRVDCSERAHLLRVHAISWWPGITADIPLVLIVAASVWMGWSHGGWQEGAKDLTKEGGKWRSAVWPKRVRGSLTGVREGAREAEDPYAPNWTLCTHANRHPHAQV